jgi:hypothetical protein
MKKILAAMTAALMMVALVSSAAVAAAPGNSLNAKACQKGGYLTLVGTAGPFATQDACVNYAKTGILYTKTPTITAANATGTWGGANVYFLHIDGPSVATYTGAVSPTWVPNVYTTVTVVETWFVTPTTYTFTKDSVPSGYQSQFNTGSAGVLANDGTLFENCIDPNGVRRTDTIPYTVTVTDALGQTSNTYSGSFNCGALQSPQMTITSVGLYNSTLVNISFAGLYFQPSELITMTTIDEYGLVDTTGYVLGTTDGSGAITVPNGSWADNCSPDGGTTVLDTDQLITITFTGSLGDVVKAQGTLKCSLLAP